MTVFKSDLIKKVAEKTGLSERKTTKTVNTFIDVLIEELAEEEVVEVRGLGVFEIYPRKGRKITNISTGEKERIKSFKIAEFRASEKLKRQINK